MIEYFPNGGAAQGAAMESNARMAARHNQERAAEEAASGVQPDPRPKPDTERRERWRKTLAEAEGWAYGDLDPHDYQQQAAAGEALSDDESAEALRISDVATSAILKARDTEIERLRAELGKARAAVDEVRRFCELTINMSIRVRAVEQARDTLTILDRHANRPADGDTEGTVS